MDGITDLIRISKKNCNGVVVSLCEKGILFMIGLSLICSGVLVPQAAWSFDQARREAFIASLPQGEIFENDESTYVLLPSLWTEKTDGRKAELAVNENPGSVQTDQTTEDVVERKGLFTVYRQSSSEQASIRTVKGQSGDVQAHPVVLNLKTKSIGIIAGKLWLKLKNMQDAQSIADSYNITLSFVNIPMETAFYDFPSEVNILTLRKRLIEDNPGILCVTLDMVDRIHLPQ
jgi:hypothetical protein